MGDNHSGQTATWQRGDSEKSKEMQSVRGSVLKTGVGVERGEGKVTVSHSYSEKVT